MELERLTLERIEELIASAHEVPPNLETPIAILPKGTGPHSLECYLPAPTRLRATFDTSRIDDFLTYVNGEATEHSAVFVLPQGGGATAILDYGNAKNPKWAEHRAKLELAQTPAYEALLALCNTRLTQRDLISWLEDWPHLIEPVRDGDESLTVGQAIAAVRKIDIKAIAQTGLEEGDWRNERTAMESIEAASAIANQMPDFYRLHTPLWEDTPEQTIRVRASLNTSGDKPSLGLRIISHADLIQSVCKEIESRIRSEVTGASVYIGSVRIGN